MGGDGVKEHQTSPPSAGVPDDPFDLDAALRASLRPRSANIDTHLICLERDIQVGQTKTKLHCYFLPVDGNGRIRMKPLAEFLRDQSSITPFRARRFRRLSIKSKRPVSRQLLSNLHERAKRLFTHLANSGEGGELLLFAMAEALFNITQIICKMTLKTSTSMHYHGADGVYAEARPDGGLNLYWGDCKIYGDAAAAIRNCLDHLRHFSSSQKAKTLRATRTSC